MPRPHTFPTLYNEALQIHVSTIKEWNCLIPKQLYSGTITWSSNGEKIASISIIVNSNSTVPYIELDYITNNEPRKYKVKLVSIPSNLGIGKIWYFLCPITHKRCRKLYLIGGYFLHREAFNRCMYESQTQSKQYRQLEKTFGAYFSSDNLYSQLYKKHFKKTYAGKPTKKYLKLIRKIEQAERITIEDIKKFKF